MGESTNPSSTPVTVDEMFAELLLLGDAGIADVKPGDDPESQQFAADIRRLNRRWKPGTIPHTRMALRGQAQISTRRHAVPQPRRREARGTRRVRTAGRLRSASKSPPGETDPPSRLRRLDGGSRESRDTKLNTAWQGVLALDLSPLELATLGEYCRIRSVWLGRWAP